MLLQGRIENQMKILKGQKLEKETRKSNKRQHVRVICSVHIEIGQTGDGRDKVGLNTDSYESKKMNLETIFR